MEKKKKKSLRREFMEWAVFLGIIAILFGTGLHTPVFGFIQGLILKTGIIQPSLESDSTVPADYNFVLIDKDGNRKSFTDFKGKVVFMNIWATWCPPCVAEMPDIHELYQDVKDKNIEFVMISVDKDFQKAKDFVKKKGFEFPIYQVAGAMPQVYESRAIPTTFVISPDGRIVSRKEGMAKYTSKKFRKFLDDLMQ